MKARFSLHAYRKLEELARAVLNDKAAAQETRDRAQGVLKWLDDAAATNAKFAEQIASERKNCDDDYEMDDLPIVATSYRGVFINTWTYVPVPALAAARNKMGAATS